MQICAAVLTIIADGVVSGTAGIVIELSIIVVHIRTVFITVPVLRLEESPAPVPSHTHCSLVQLIFLQRPPPVVDIATINIQTNPAIGITTACSLDQLVLVVLVVNGGQVSVVLSAVALGLRPGPWLVDEVVLGRGRTGWCGGEPCRRHKYTHWVVT